MNKLCRRTDLPVLLIHNLDPAWEREQILAYRAETHLLINALIEIGHPVQEVCVQSADLEAALEGYNPSDYVVFNWCEELPGVPHSEYRVAQILEQMGFTYTGANAQALALGQDKRRVKHVLQMQGIPTPGWQVYTVAQPVRWKRFPAIVKPAFEHCGYGISRQSVVLSKAELSQSLEFVLRELQQPALVEDFIDGREFHVGAIGNNGSLRVLPAAEIDYSQFDDIHDRLCTYESNFDETSLAYRLTLPKLPVVLATDLRHQLEAVVTSAYQVTSCRDYARMDVRLQDGVFYILDVNHNADISACNSLTMAAAMIGLSYGQLGSLFINLAARRHPVFGAV